MTAAVLTRPAHPGAPGVDREPSPPHRRGRLPGGAAPDGPPRVPAARRAGRLGPGGRRAAHRRAHPARRPDRPRPAAAPRDRARAPLAGAVPPRSRPPSRTPSARSSPTGPAAPRCSTTASATSPPSRASGRSPRPPRPATPSSAPAPAWPTPSTRTPPRRSSTCCRCSPGTCPTASGRRSAAPPRNTLSGREQMLVLGLALEDACALDRARLLAGLSPAARTAWRVVGRRNFRATVVRLRGAPPRRSMTVIPLRDAGPRPATPWG